MRTIQELKEITGFMQTDDYFLSFIALLNEKGVIKINDGDINHEEGLVSDSFFQRLSRVYGVDDSISKENSWLQD